jgi:hypothetical protein
LLHHYRDIPDRNPGLLANIAAIEAAYEGESSFKKFTILKSVSDCLCNFITTESHRKILFNTSSMK